LGSCNGETDEGPGRKADAIFLPIRALETVDAGSSRVARCLIERSVYLFVHIDLPPVKGQCDMRNPPLFWLLACGAALALLAGGAGQAKAAVIFSASLTLDQEVGPPPRIPTLSPAGGGGPRPHAFGYGIFVLNDAMTEFSMDVTVFHIDVTANSPNPGGPAGTPQTPDTFDNLVAAHIHAAALTGQPGTNAGVVWGFFGLPDHNTAPDDLVITPFSAGSPGPGGETVGGRFTAVWNLAEGAGGGLAGQLPNIFAGRSYINFHTTQFGGGEIRGQITPEPSTLTIGGFGAVVGLCAAWRRRKRAASAT
jgi:hypothetical protein